MSDNHVFTSNRLRVPDPAALLASLRAIDATAGFVAQADGSFRVKISSAFVAPVVASMQGAIDTAPDASPALTAQAWVDAMPIEEKAILLVLLDEINRLREWIASFKAAVAASTTMANLKTGIAALPDMPDRTIQQGIQAVRDKAGTL